MGSTYHPSSVWTHSRSPELDPEFRHVEMPLTKNNTGILNVDTITMDGRKSTFDLFLLRGKHSTPLLSAVNPTT